MIEKLIPLTKNKMEILKMIYEKQEIHLSHISKQLKLYPFSVQKTLSKIKPFLKEKKAGKTILFSLDKTQARYLRLIELIEDYRLTTKNEIVNSVIKHLTNLFSDEHILVCCLFGSYARMNFTEESDIDILLVVKEKNAELKKKVSQISSILGREVNPLILSEKEFEKLVKNKEASIMTLKEPSQRLIIKGVKYFLTISAEN